MTAATWRGDGTGGNDAHTVNTSTSVSQLPTAAAVGDVAFAVATNVSSSTLTTPTGWTVLQGPTTSTTVMSRYVLYKVLAASDIDISTGGTGNGQITFTWSQAGRVTSSVVVMYNVDATNIITSTALITTGLHTSDTAPSVTTTSTDMQVMQFWSGRFPTTSPGPSISNPGTGFTKGEEARFANTGGVTNSSSTCLYLTTTGAAGSYGGQTVTYAGTGTNPSVLTTVAIGKAVAAPVRTRHRFNGSIWVPETRIRIT